MEGERMQTIEMCFNNTIEKHTNFRHAAASLLQNISILTPSEIDQRCRELENLHVDLLANKDYLFALMEFMGPGILDTAYIGEFQRALNKSIEICEDLYKKILNYRDSLTSNPDFSTRS